MSGIKGQKDVKCGYCPHHMDSNNKIKFRRQKMNLKGIEKSPMMRGIKIWDMLPPGLQRATTKVKFKTELKKLICSDLMTP